MDTRCIYYRKCHDQVMAPNFTILVIGRILSSAAASLIIVKVLALTTDVNDT